MAKPQKQPERVKPEPPPPPTPRASQMVAVVRRVAPGKYEVWEGVVAGELANPKLLEPSVSWTVAVHAARGAGKRHAELLERSWLATAEAPEEARAPEKTK